MDKEGEGEGNTRFVGLANGHDSRMVKFRSFAHPTPHFEPEDYG
jgi:hypothetical protein